MLCFFSMCVSQTSFGQSLLAVGSFRLTSSLSQHVKVRELLYLKNICLDVLINNQVSAFTM